MTPPARIEFEKEFTERLTVHKNIGQEVVITTVDKVRICLMDHRERLAAKNEWLTPFSLFLALVTTLAAAEFRQFILRPSVWEAAYILGACATLGWLLITLQRAWNNRSHTSIDSIVATLKAQSPTAGSAPPQ